MGFSFFAKFHVVYGYQLDAKVMCENIYRYYLDWKANKINVDPPTLMEACIETLIPMAASICFDDVRLSPFRQVLETGDYADFLDIMMPCGHVPKKRRMDDNKLYNIDGNESDSETVQEEKYSIRDNTSDISELMMNTLKPHLPSWYDDSMKLKLLIRYGSSVGRWTPKEECKFFLIVDDDSHYQFESGESRGSWDSRIEVASFDSSIYLEQMWILTKACHLLQLPVMGSPGIYAIASAETA
jgi:hypothetical protein